MKSFRVGFPKCTSFFLVRCPFQEPDRVYHYFPDKKYDRDRRRNSWERDDLNPDRGGRPYTSLRAASVKDLGDVAAVIERLEGQDSRRRLVIRT